MVMDLAEIFEKLCRIRREAQTEPLIAALEDAVTATGAAMTLAAKNDIDDLAKPDNTDAMGDEDKGGGFLS